MPLGIGDGIFFNPALLHAPGENVTLDFERSANFVQISGTFGNLMETMDTLALVERCWEGVTQKYVPSTRNEQ